MYIETYFTRIKEEKNRTVEVWEIAGGIFGGDCNFYEQ